MIQLSLVVSVPKTVEEFVVFTNDDRPSICVVPPDFSEMETLTDYFLTLKGSDLLVGDFVDLPFVDRRPRVPIIRGKVIGILGRFFSHSGLWWIFTF